MLTAENYELAWMAYGGASVAALVILYFWVGRRVPWGIRLSIALLLGALVLTPAHPAPDLQTWAPAVVVAGFELLTNGIDAAARPFRSVIIAEAMVLVLCLLTWLGFRILGRRQAEAGASDS